MTCRPAGPRCRGLGVILFFHAPRCATSDGGSAVALGGSQLTPPVVGCGGVAPNTGWAEGGVRAGRAHRRATATSPPSSRNCDGRSRCCVLRGGGRGGEGRGRAFRAAASVTRRPPPTAECATRSRRACRARGIAAGPLPCLASRLSCLAGLSWGRPPGLEPSRAFRSDPPERLCTLLRPTRLSRPIISPPSSLSFSPSLSRPTTLSHCHFSSLSPPPSRPPTLLRVHSFAT